MPHYTDNGDRQLRRPRSFLHTPGIDAPLDAIPDESEARLWITRVRVHGRPVESIYFTLFHEECDLAAHGRETARTWYFSEHLPPQLARRRRLPAAISRVRPIRRHIHRMFASWEDNTRGVVWIAWMSQASMLAAVQTMVHWLYNANRIRLWNIRISFGTIATNPLTDYDVRSGRPCTFGMSEQAIRDVNDLFEFQPSD